LVSVGGDLRVEGDAPQGAWSVAVEDPRDPPRLGPVLALAAGGCRHLDPGRPPVALRACRPPPPVLACDRRARRRAGGVGDRGPRPPAAWAEALTKVPFVRGAQAGVAILQDMDVAALVVSRDGVPAGHGLAGVWSTPRS
jgi:hypothetical protein